ncbi:MAG: hypothetical protein H7321_08445 [Bacteroidia bacterium]|nr:hypothetical protein [Bacteroidia bacterium]
MYKLFITAMVISAVVFSCKPKPPSPKDILFQDITKLQKDPDLIYSDTLFNSYHRYITLYPTDPKCAHYLLLSADIAGRRQRSNDASLLYEQYANTYKDSAEAGEALFLAASLKEKMNDHEESKRIFSQYLVFYPDGPRNAEIRQIIPFLGLTGEQLIEVFRIPEVPDSTKVKNFK